MKISELLNEDKTKRLTKGELSEVSGAVKSIWNDMITKDAMPPKFKAKLEAGEYKMEQAVRFALDHIIDSKGDIHQGAYKALDLRLHYWDVLPQVVKEVRGKLKMIDQPKGVTENKHEAP